MKPLQSLFSLVFQRPRYKRLAVIRLPLARHAHSHAHSHTRTPTCFAFSTVLEEKRDRLQSIEIHGKDKGIEANEDQDFYFCGCFEKSRLAWLHKEPV